MGLTQALLDACTAQALAVAVADAPASVGTKPYVVIWPDGPVRTATALADSLGEQTTVFTCHCVGLTPDSAEVAEKKLAAAVVSLYGQVIDGQQVMFPVQDWPPGMTRDDDVSPPIYDMAATWRLRTTPA